MRRLRALYLPSGRYLRTVKGIFFSRNSMMAICRQNVCAQWNLPFNHSASSAVLKILHGGQQSPSLRVIKTDLQRSKNHCSKHHTAHTAQFGYKLWLAPFDPGQARVMQHWLAHRHSVHAIMSLLSSMPSIRVHCWLAVGMYIPQEDLLLLQLPPSLEHSCCRHQG